MPDWLSMVTILAQDEPQRNPWGELFGQMMPMVLGFMFLWYFIIVRPQRRDQARRQDLLNSLKKNDRVVTIGGIIGTVANVSADGKEITLKVDDNARIRFLRSSIQTVLRDEPEADSSKKT